MSMPMRSGWILWPLIVNAALIVAAACAGSEAAVEERAADRQGMRLRVQRGDLTSRMLLSGELIAEDAEQLVAPNVNIWPLQIRWLAEDGIEVREGDKVVEFDNSQLVANLEEMLTRALEAANQLASLRARAASEEATSAFELEQQRAAVEKARLEAEVPQEMFPALDFQKLQLDWRKAELELAQAEAKLRTTRQAKQAEIEIQRIALAKAEAEVVRAEARIGLLTLHASRDGILILGSNDQEGRQLQVGDGVSPGRAVARLPDLTSMVVSARLFDVDDGRVAVGMSVTATLDAFPEVTYTGRVREIDQIADQASRRSLRRFFRTRIDLDRLDVERMRPGMSVKVVVEGRYEDVLMVPRECLDRTAEEPRALLADGTWAPVELGVCDAMACVVAGGLEEATALGRAAGPEVGG